MKGADMQEAFENIIEQLEELKKAEIERDDLCDEEGFGDGEEIYEDGKSQGRFEQVVRIIEIVKQEAEQYNNAIIDGKYCFQSCACTEKCDKCSRLCNGYIDWYENIDNWTEEYNNGWIPFVQREMTEDEKESFGDLNFMLDCQLPDEDEEILITYKFKDELYVYVDTFMRDGSECYLDSGRDFVTEAVAWRKKPQPYHPKGE